MELTLDEALSKGIDAHKQGHISEAEKLYAAILKLQPGHPDANHNMGILAVGIGKTKESLPFFRAAIEANHHITQFWVSYIDALIKLNMLADALIVCTQANELGHQNDVLHQLKEQLSERVTNKDIPRVLHQENPTIQNPPREQLQSLINLYLEGSLQQALSDARLLLEQYPESFVLNNIAGVCSAGLMQFDSAIEYYKQAIKINPDYADAYNNLGIALNEMGDPEAALAYYKRALQINPEYAEAYHNYGVSLNNSGDPVGALKSYHQALRLNPGSNETWYNASQLLTGIVFSDPHPDLQELISSLLVHKHSARPVTISRAAISLLKFDPNTKHFFYKSDSDKLETPIAKLASDLRSAPLLYTLMISCPLPDPELEATFKNIRFSLLTSIFDIKSSPDILHLQSALARQCFINEYVYSKSGTETELLHALEFFVKKELLAGNQPSPHLILCLASYRPLNSYEFHELITNSTEISEVFKQQISEPKCENEIKKNIPVLNEIIDSVSSKVREQYEENPYPRWVKPCLCSNPLTISKRIKELNLRIYDHRIHDVEYPEILIAGCGTGQHSTETSTLFRKSTVLAIDISLTSLAYAKRKTQELGLQNLDYLQADILDIGKLGQQFDIIESGGVLHHMKDPLAGWMNLTSSLKPGGLMKIGLYSEYARQHIVAIREDIKNSGIGSGDEAIRSFRNDIVNSKHERHLKVRSSTDFYSLSELRDLLFHTQEHRFTLPQIQNCLDELGLKFCGFEAKEIIRDFKLTNTGPDDAYNLSKWHDYEKLNPHTFGMMYQFWCQKIA